ncbi:MAG: AAA family ATPase [Bacteroidales bacterium]|nr:AAA family ATPase [Bacteroidales bacterium]MBN2820198.1 AAA family ATPase [Bacteroidales bacterium]
METIKLSAFRIKNFRSIIDSGWRSLANDGITILIGQNESGKTSVLEALQSFFDNMLLEDVLRSDNSLPVVSCKFRLEDKRTVVDLLDKKMLENEVFSILKEQKEFEITREWTSSQTNTLYISTADVHSFYSQKIEAQKLLEEKSKKEIESLLGDTDSLIKKLDAAEQEKTETQNELSAKRKELEQKQKALRRAKKPDQKLIAEKELDTCSREYKLFEDDFTQKLEIFEQLKNRTQELSEKISIGKLYQGLLQKQELLKGYLADCNNKISDLEHLYEISTHEKDKKGVLQKIHQQKQELSKLQQEIHSVDEQTRLQMFIATKVFNAGTRLKQAETEAQKEIFKLDKFFDMQRIGESLFKYIPVFEFFEDFSGLLPNKIDLEDILNENHHAEGYKAALNFLKLAGLEPSFFREKNHRILKQRIECLNSDITINFHDYWSQNVGKDNRIKLHFELEHYDYTVPEKSGKPYLEFWVKDNQERLYPKQRSRGVRWFLSFYLELKAAATRNNTNRVLLIDEPGLSLHARAQEDVLKVFEDLKTKMQVVYSTHSPHLVKPEKLYRILAVQRANESDDTSETLVLDPNSLSEASADTLSPIYSLMGIRLSEQQFIRSEKNIIVPDQISYYYLTYLSKIYPDMGDVTFIPATGIHTIPSLVNILSAWQVKYGLLLLGSNVDKVIEDLHYNSLLSKSGNSILHLKEFEIVEDLFSAIDFKKLILLQRIGITEKNSEFIAVNGLSRNILATNFVNNFNDAKFSYNDLDESTKENLEKLFAGIKKIL